MLKCKQCNGSFPHRKIIDGKLRYLNSRRYCLTCSPWTGKHGARLKLSPEDRRISKLNSQLRNRYNIDITDLQEMQISQDNKCAICKCNPPNSNKKRLSVDHDHISGKVRGLLCTSCNIKLGWFEKHSDMIIAYLSMSLQESN